MQCSVLNNNIENGTLTVDCRDPNCVATYSCQSGFSLEGGDRTRTCVSNEGNFMWEGSAPSCVSNAACKCVYTVDYRVRFTRSWEWYRPAQLVIDESGIAAES